MNTILGLAALAIVGVCALGLLLQKSPHTAKPEPRALELSPLVRGLLLSLETEPAAWRKSPMLSMVGHRRFEINHDNGTGITLHEDRSLTLRHYADEEELASVSVYIPGADCLNAPHLTAGEQEALKSAVKSLFAAEIEEANAEARAVDERQRSIAAAARRHFEQLPPKPEQ